MLRVRVSWRPSAKRKVTSICPRNLYSRLHPEILKRTADAMTAVSKAITNLLIATESGATRPDEPVFVERMAHNRARKAALEADVQSLERLLSTSKMRITEQMIAAFGEKMVARFAGVSRHSGPPMSGFSSAASNSRPKKSESSGRRTTSKRPLFGTMVQIRPECPSLTASGAPGRTRTDTPCGTRF